jgi:hypothetical protein
MPSTAAPTRHKLASPTIATMCRGFDDPWEPFFAPAERLAMLFSSRSRDPSALMRLVSGRYGRRGNA